jgi:hypothetical protein
MILASNVASTAWANNGPLTLHVAANPKQRYGVWIVSVDVQARLNPAPIKALRTDRTTVKVGDQPCFYDGLAKCARPK